MGNWRRSDPRGLSCGGVAVAASSQQLLVLLLRTALIKGAAGGDAKQVSKEFAVFVPMLSKLLANDEDQGKKKAQLQLAALKTIESWFSTEV